MVGALAVITTITNRVIWTYLLIDTTTILITITQGLRDEL